MKYIPGSISSANIDVARSAMLGAEFAVYVTAKQANLLGQINLTPFAAIRFDAMWQGSYAETSAVAGSSTPGSLGLRYSAHNVTSVPGSLGLRVDTSVQMNDGIVISPSVRLSWVHEFAPTRAIDAAFLAAPGFGFNVRGAPAAQDAARVDVGVSARFSPKVVLYGNFVGVLSGEGSTLGGFGGFKYSF